VDPPNVILDVVFDEGLLFLSLANIGDLPAVEVRVEFDPPFSGLDGSLAVSSMPLFRRLSFLAPKKRIVTLLDSSASYFHRNQPAEFTAHVSWAGLDEKRHESMIRHDLEIYRDLPFVPGRPKGGGSC
jgi:hypothetical protein